MVPGGSRFWWLLRQGLLDVLAHYSATGYGETLFPLEGDGLRRVQAAGEAVAKLNGVRCRFAATVVRVFQHLFVAIAPPREAAPIEDHGSLMAELGSLQLELRKEARATSVTMTLVEALATTWPVWLALHVAQRVQSLDVSPAAWAKALLLAPSLHILPGRGQRRSSWPAAYFARFLRSEFSGDGHRLPRLLERLRDAIREAPKLWMALLPRNATGWIVDVGASCGNAEVLGPCFITHALAAFEGVGYPEADVVSCPLRATGFEPEPSNFAATQASLEAGTKALPPSIRKCWSLLPYALSHTADGLVTLHGRAHWASLTVQYLGDYAGSTLVPRTTLDAWAEARGFGSSVLLVVKVDVEGHEVDVLRGMIQILRGRRALMVILEYSQNWSPSFREAYHRRSPGRLVRPPEAGRSLAAVTEWFSALGYDAFAISSDGHLLPLGHWRGPAVNIAEVCQHPWDAAFRGFSGFCWQDVAFLDRSKAASRQLQHMALPPALRRQS